MTTLDTSRGPCREVRHAILAQVGWVGHRHGTVYSMDSKPHETEPGGYSPLYIQVGTYATDDDGNKTWEE